MMRGEGKYERSVPIEEVDQNTRKRSKSQGLTNSSHRCPVEHNM